MSVHVISNRLVARQDLLSLIYDSLVLEDSAVFRKVDGGGCVAVLVVDTLSLGVTFAESL